MTQKNSTGAKSTRAFRTISEAADELELQAHVLRFWESKFADIQPMKRRGGRRFYRPEDIEFIRGIKILLHREKHPIKDVQKLIRIKGAQSVRELGRSVEQAAKPKNIKDTNLVPKRIKPVINKPVVKTTKYAAAPPDTPVTEKPAAKPQPDNADIVRRPGVVDLNEHRSAAQASPQPVSEPVSEPVPASKGIKPEDKSNLEDALQRLKKLKSRWQEFT